MSVHKYPGLLDEEESYETAQTMDPKLYRAIMKDDILEFVRAMECDRQHGPTVSCVQLGPQNKTVLHVATSFGSYEIVKLICKDLPDLVAEKNARGDTALHIAARAGSSQLVTLLVNSEFAEGGLREKNEEGNTALHEALKYGHEEVARILINRNPLMSYSLNKEGKSLLYLAAGAGFLIIVRLLMDNPVGSYSTGAKHKNKSPVFAAILEHNIGSKHPYYSLFSTMYYMIFCCNLIMMSRKDCLKSDEMSRDTAIIFRLIMLLIHFGYIYTHIPVSSFLSSSYDIMLFLTFPFLFS